MVFHPPFPVSVRFGHTEYATQMLSVLSAANTDLLGGDNNISSKIFLSGYSIEIHFSETLLKKGN
jgi:hypothetical protein